MRWVDEDFIKRVEIRAAALGKTLSQVAIEAGVAKEYFRKPPQHGRNISGILKLAALLKVAPAELMGLTEPPQPTRRVLRDYELAIAVSLAVRTYCTLTKCRDDDIPEVIATVIRSVREEFRKPTPAKEAAPSE